MLQLLQPLAMRELTEINFLLPQTGNRAPDQPFGLNSCIIMIKAQVLSRPATTIEKPPGYAIEIEQPRKGYRYNQDPFHLAGFIEEHYDLWHNQLAGRCLDLGCGVGVLPLLLTRKLTKTRFTGIEIQDELARLAIRNCQRNRLGDRIRIINADYRDYNCRRDGIEFFQCVISNPPYYPEAGGRINRCPQKRIARHEINSNLASLTQTAALSLNNKGLFIIIFPAERLLDLTTHLKTVKLEPKHLKFIHPKGSERAVMLLMAARKNGAPGIIIEEPLFI